MQNCFDNKVINFIFEAQYTMVVNVISPIGNMPGMGTYNTMYNGTRYKWLHLAAKANEYVVINFVQNEAMSISFQVYSSKAPDDKRYLLLSCQDVSAGVCPRDEEAVIDIAMDLLRKM